MKNRSLLWFLAGSLLLCGLVFRDALWGRSLLAPLDIPTTLFSKFRAIDPQASAVPANHYVFDGATYDLPLQFTVYKALRRGEIPWWDPYTYSGRPLLADARVNGTDPIRLACYCLLPFELAYNWTRVLHHILTGLGMFLLLRHFGFKTWICLLLGWTYQFAGCHTMTFTDPWVQASLAYYPFLWLVWDAGMKDRLSLRMAQASVLIGCIFYAGNQQSHAYVVLFAMAFLAAYGWESKGSRFKLFSLVALSGILGACVAAPVLFNEVEFFLLNVRTVGAEWKMAYMGRGIASLSAVFPWCMGTFRTLDIGKFMGQTALGFHLFIGSAGFLLALFGVIAGGKDRIGPARRMALLLVVGYLVLISTKMVHFLYLRMAAMAVIGLVVLAALGIEVLMAGERPWRRAAWAIGIATVLGAITLNIGALIIYPRLMDRVKQVVQARQESSSLEMAPELRLFQVQNLPAELSFKNPETLLAVAGLLGFALLMGSRTWRVQPRCWMLLMMLNLVPVLLFAGRFDPRHRMELWHALKRGGTEQQAIASRLGGTPLRLWEQAPGLYDQALPYTLPHLYQVRTISGYTSLMAPNPYYLLPEYEERIRPQIADWIYRSPERGAMTGQLVTNATPGMARFQWLGAVPRLFQVRDEGLNAIRIEFQPGATGHLLWADTHYPGWSAQADGKPVALAKQEPCFSRIEIPAAAREVRLHYRPRFLNAGLGLAAGGALVVGLLAGGMFRRRSVRAT